MAKKVCFFQTKLLDKDSNELDYQKIGELLKAIIEKFATDNRTYKSMDLTAEGNTMHVILDVFEYTKDRLFCRLSKQTPSNSMIQREYKTLQQKEVLPGVRPSTKGIEHYTYCMLNYDTGILSIILAQKAPSEKVLSGVFEKAGRKERFEFIPIPNAKAIETIYYGKNAEIGSVEIEIPTPDPAVLCELLGWTDEEVTKLVANKNLKASVQVKSLQRGNVMVDEARRIKSFIDQLKKCLPGYNKAKMKAKTKAIKMREFNLFEDNFTSPIDIRIYKIENGEKVFHTVDELVNIYKKSLNSAYRENQKLLKAMINR